MSLLVRQMLRPSPGGFMNITAQLCRQQNFVNRTLTEQNYCFRNNSLLNYPNGIKSTLPILSSVISVMNFHTTACTERARQSTRIRKRKVYMANKKKKEERLRKNPPPLPYKVQLMLRNKGITETPDSKREIDEKPFPTDDVWDEIFFTWKRHSVEQALAFLRDHYHPTMLDDSSALVNIRVEFDLSTNKKEKYVEPFSKMIPLFHAFERGVVEKSVLVFANTMEDQNAALEAGAKKAGGADLIDDIAKGKVDIIDFDYFIAHDDIALELKPLLGMLRDQYPKKNLGTVGTDMRKMVKTFCNGQMIEMVKPKPIPGTKEDPTFAYCNALIGRLDMKDEEIKDNLETILEGLVEAAPKKTNAFLQRVKIFVDDRIEKFTVHSDLINDKKYKDYVKKAAKA